MTLSVLCIPWHLRARTICGSALFIIATGALAQSTLGSISGTIKDPTGAVIPGADIRLHRIESNTDVHAASDASGAYSALNVADGHYDIAVQAPGFKLVTARNINLLARQQLRYDLVEVPGGTTETVSVDAAEAGVINTEDAQISAALSPQAVIDLPSNYRGAGSTSPLAVVQALPGVQPDNASYPPAPSTHPAPSVRFSIQGGLPSQSETTVDGISAQNQTSNNIQGDAFPSAESIAEIRVDGVNNNAEYGQPGEITTITKSGTNRSRMAPSSSTCKTSSSTPSPTEPTARTSRTRLPMTSAPALAARSFCHTSITAATAPSSSALMKVYASRNRTSFKPRFPPS